MSLALNGTEGVTYNDGTLQSSAPGGKNLIINGNMQIAQRGTSVAGITSSAGGYNTVDRFAYTISSGGGTWTQSQEADAPEGFAKSLKLSCTATGTYGATTNWNALYQSIEGFNLQQLKYGTANAESLTVSFWVKSNQTGTYSILYYGGDSGRSIASEYTILSANTWEKKTITIAGDTSGIINNDNGSALSLYFTLAAGSLRWSNALQTSWGAYDVNGSVPSSQVQLGGSLSDYLQITGVQLEVGDTATDFENLQYGTQLALCQRYFQICGFHGVAYNTTEMGIASQFKVNMRTQPSMSTVLYNSDKYTGSANTIVRVGVGNTATTSASYNSPSSGNNIGNILTTGLTANNIYFGSFQASAEL